MNKFIGIGNWAKEQDVRYSQGETPLAMARCSMAFNRGKDKGTDFLNTVAFGKTAEFLEKYARKGQKMAIEGHIQTGSYEKDGKKVYTTDVVIDKCEFVESKGAEENAPVSKEEKLSKQVESSGFINLDSIEEEELPFR